MNVHERHNWLVKKDGYAFYCKVAYFLSACILMICLSPISTKGMIALLLLLPVISAAGYYEGAIKHEIDTMRKSWING